MTYLESGDPARSLTDYYPSWLDSLADDVTIEGSAMDGVAQGAEAARTILVTRNAAGQTQHIVASYRPRSSLLLLSRLVGEKLADTPYAKHFAASKS